MSVGEIFSLGTTRLQVDSGPDVRRQAQGAFVKKQQNLKTNRICNGIWLHMDGKIVHVYSVVKVISIDHT